MKQNDGRQEPVRSRLVERGGGLMVQRSVDRQAGASSASMYRHEALAILMRHRQVRLVVVHAPAGFGKSILLRQYCRLRQAEGASVGWLHLDRRSSEPARFPVALDQVIEAAAGGPRPAGVAGPVQAQGPCRGGAIVVIDDFEQLQDLALQGAFAQAVRGLPEGMQVCIATRAVPAINLARLQVQEQALVIGSGQLRFTLAETAEFFRPFPGLSAEEIAQLHRCADGWPAALQCIRLCLRHGRLRRDVALASDGITPELMDFLATDVFDALGDRTQRLLLAACVPEQICADLLSCQTGGEFGGEDLAELERLGLFLAPIDLEKSWYRFHHVFRRFLLIRLKREIEPAMLCQCHRRVATWCAGNGLADEAVLHWLEAADPQAAVDALAAVADQLVAQERLALIVRCVDALPEAALRRHESVLRAAGIAYAFRRQFASANRVLALLREVLQQRGADAQSWGYCNFVQVFALAAQDRIPEMDAVALQTMRQLGPEHPFQHAVALNAHAFHLVACSRFEQAQVALQAARALHDQAGNLFGQAYQEFIYSNLLSAQGRIDDALRGLSTALRRLAQGHTPRAGAGAVIGAYLADALYERNCLDDAEAVLGDYAALVEQEAIVDPLAVTFITAARIAAVRGREGQADDILERAIYLGQRYQLPRIVRYARAELVRHATLQGDLELAGQRLAAMGESEPDGLMFHAGETESCGITGIRLLIAQRRLSDANGLLQDEIGRARAARRKRRLLKLNLLRALALDAEGRAAAACRALVEALELAQPGGFVRCLLDEGPALVRLLEQARPTLVDDVRRPGREALTDYLDRLLSEAGGVPAQAAPQVAWRVGTRSAPALIERLTDRERTVLHLVASGMPNKALADRLSVSTNTVKWHMRNIFEKLHITNRVQAIVVARQFGLIDWHQ